MEIDRLRWLALILECYPTTVTEILIICSICPCYSHSKSTFCSYYLLQHTSLANSSKFTNSNESVCRHSAVCRSWVGKSTRESVNMHYKWRNTTRRRVDTLSVLDIQRIKQIVLKIYLITRKSFKNIYRMNYLLKYIKSNI